jgi:hypothetical protein
MRKLLSALKRRLTTGTRCRPVVSGGDELPAGRPDYGRHQLYVDGYPLDGQKRVQLPSTSTWRVLTHVGARRFVPGGSAPGDLCLVLAAGTNRPAEQRGRGLDGRTRTQQSGTRIRTRCRKLGTGLP